LLPAGASTAGSPIAGAGFGAGGRVGMGPDEGTFGWSGAAGTVFAVQRRLGLRAALYPQFMPTTIFPLQKEFLAAARTDAVASLGAVKS
ncbi:MAG: serine hydrolase, partial [Novosphingobium sp.]